MYWKFEGGDFGQESRACFVKDQKTLVEFHEKGRSEGSVTQEVFVSNGEGGPTSEPASPSALQGFNNHM